MTDLELLRKVIDESGYKMQYIARCLDLSYQGFLNKAKGLSKFDNEEIVKFCNLLGINRDVMLRIFFAEKSDET